MASRADACTLSSNVWSDLAARRPTFWLNDRPRPAATSPVLKSSDVADAASRWKRFAPVLAALFPADLPHGVIESALLRIPQLTARYLSQRAPENAHTRILLKADHDLPLCGSVKARGGIYEVLRFAERIAHVEGILADERDDYAKLALSGAARTFACYRIVVASTGNLGYAVGVVARALGFAVTVHMSAEAKVWKKAHLRHLGCDVVEHATDYTGAVVAAREACQNREGTHFVDDERSADLFLGYSAVGYELAEQLLRLDIAITAKEPLCLYLPCGVGGAPGGILFGTRALLGEAVHGFFAEPTASPCMLLRLLKRLPSGATVYDLGLDNRTIADGLAVARASELVVQLVGEYVAGAYTVSDEEMLRWVARAHQLEGLRLEPSAAVGLPGALRLVWESLPLESCPEMAAATHVVWTTGGRLLPDDEFHRMLLPDTCIE